MRVVAATVLVVVLLLVLGDFLVTNLAEDRAGAQVSAGLSADADVDLRGWPVSLRLLARRVPEVGLVATDVPLRDTPASLTRLDATLRGVDVPWTWTGQLDGEIRADAGTFTAELDETAIQSLVDLPITVTLEEGVVRASIGGAQLDATAEVEEGAIVLRPAAGAFANLGELRLPLQGLPEGAAVEGVAIEPGVLRLRGRLDGLVIDPATAPADGAG